MSNNLVTSNDVAQMLSQTLMDVSMGREVNKTKLQKHIDIADALNRRMQTKINLMKVMIEAKKNGIDFSQSMKEISKLVQDTDSDMGNLAAIDG